MPIFGNSRRLRRLEDRTQKPVIPRDRVTLTQSFEYPPGHVDVSRDGRIFLDPYHYGPRNPDFQIAELVDGQLIPFPDPTVQKPLHRAHSLRLDTRSRLWVNDHGSFGLHTPKVVAYDLSTGQEVFRHELPRHLAGIGSMLNDLVYDEARDAVYISNPSPLAGQPSLIIIDVAAGTSRRVLERHPSVQAREFDIVVEGDVFRFLGLIPARLAVDGLVVHPDEQALYYSPLNSGDLHRVPLDALHGPSPSPERVGDITMTDGMALDAEGRILLTDVEHSAIVRRERDGSLTTLVKHPDFRWPGNVAFGPDGTLYFTTDAVDRVTLKSDRRVRDNGPYGLFAIPASQLP